MKVYIVFRCGGYDEGDEILGIFADEAEAEAMRAAGDHQTLSGISRPYWTEVHEVVEPGSVGAP